MSFLQELQEKRNKLKATDTIITREDGKKFMESKSGVQKLEEECCGFVIDTKPDLIPACILAEGLYLGSQDSVVIENLNKYNISHILSIGIELFSLDLPIALNIKYIPCLDLPETNLESIIVQSNEFIDASLESGQNVLVHCNAGVSRSAAIIIGYLIINKRMSFVEAFDLVKSKRECIQPNVGFIRQLKNL